MQPAGGTQAVLDVEALVSHVRALSPGLPLEPAHARLDTGGQNNVVLIANNRFVFRFPRFPEALDRLREEVALLRAIAPSMPLLVPNPQFLGLDLPPGKACMGYEMIPGTALKRDTYERLSGSERQRVASQIAGFLWTLHHIAVHELPVRPPVAADRATWADLYQRIRTRLFPLMRPSARADVTAHFDAVLGSATFWTYEPALIHGDFGASNIMFDKVSCRVTGVIDFGSSCIGDPANDIAALTSRNSLPEESVRLMDAAYPGAAHLLERARFYRGTFALQYALFGAESGNDEALADGLARYL